MKSNKPKDWIKIVENKMKERNIKFVIFLLSKNNNDLYKDLKEHSLCTKGYISQVIKYENYQKAIKKGRAASYISKILLQINCKLGGANYLLNLDKTMNDMNIMLIAIDFGLNASHTWKKREKGVITMIATKDKYFSNFYAQNEIINCKKEGEYILSIQQHLSNFIDVAIKKYEKQEKKQSPKNIIFYRQGISQYQKENVISEIKIIEEILNKKNINYYYVIVNTKSSLKLFETNLKKTQKESGDYKNPEPGLVVLDQVTDNNKFEFYLQPQKVTEGSATPTSFHVIYGNMNFPEILIKLSYWSTYIYPNWQNAVRIPHVLKLAEKFSSMTSKYTRKRNHANLAEYLASL